MTEARDAGAMLLELVKRMRSGGPRYKSHDLGFVDSVGVNTVEDWADELEQAAATLRAEHDRLRAAWQQAEESDSRNFKARIAAELRAENAESSVQALRQALEEIIVLRFKNLDATCPDCEPGCTHGAEHDRITKTAKAALALPGEAAQEK